MAFKLGDITRDPIPVGDAVLCRDCLVHLPFDLAKKAIRRIAYSGAKYLIATTFPGHPENQPTDRPGPWRPLDMTKPPFGFPEPTKIIRERAPNPDQAYSNKSVGVWDMARIRLAVEQWGS